MTFLIIFKAILLVMVLCTTVYSLSHVIFKKPHRVFFYLSLMMIVSASNAFVNTQINESRNLWLQNQTRMLIKYMPKKIPVLALIKKDQPKQYQLFLTEIKNHISQTQSLRGIGVLARQFAEKVLPKYLSHAPDWIIKEYLNSNIDLFSYIYTQDPKIVLMLTFPQKFSEQNLFLSIFMDSDKGKYYLNKMSPLETEVIKQAIEHPKYNNNQDNIKAQKLIDKTMLWLIEKYGKNKVVMTFTDPSNPEADKNSMAAIIIDFYKHIANFNDRQTGKIMRHLMLAISNQEVILHEQTKTKFDA